MSSFFDCREKNGKPEEKMSDKSEGQGSKVILFSYWRSSASWRVRWALNLKGVDFEYHAVNLVKGEQTDEKYKLVNPFGAVPALVIDGETFAESVAIIEYLDETRTGAPLFPKDPKKRARVRQIVEMVNADIHPVQNLRILKKVGDEGKAAWAKHFIEVGFEGINSI